MSIQIKKVKTKQEEVWDLTVNGTKVGQAVAIHKTATQRTWNGKVSIPLVGGTVYTAELEGIKSVAKLVNAFVDGVGDGVADVAAPAAPVKQAKSKFPAKLTRAMINPGNAIELSEHYGYSIVAKDNVARTGAEQALYLRGLVEKKAATVAKTPMSDLVEQARGGEIKGSSLAEHYADA